MSEDMLNVMGSFISTELDAFENLHKELEEKDKEIERLNNIINNAKTFIQESCYDYDYDTYSNMFNTEVKELVDILGSDKE